LGKTQTQLHKGKSSFTDLLKLPEEVRKTREIKLLQYPETFRKHSARLPQLQLLRKLSSHIIRSKGLRWINN